MLEDRLQQLLDDAAPDPPVAIDVESVRRGARRRRARGAAIALAGTSLAIAGLTAGLVTLLGDQDAPGHPDLGHPPTSDAGTTGWERLPDLPLSPRWGSLTTWTGEEALVVGGYSQRYIGGPAPRADLRDVRRGRPLRAVRLPESPRPGLLRVCHRPRGGGRAIPDRLPPHGRCPRV